MLNLVCIGMLTLMLGTSVFLLIGATRTMDKIDAGNDNQTSGARTINLNIFAAILQLLAFLFDGSAKVMLQTYTWKGNSDREMATALRQII